ncbi:type VI secretion system baseplate subunit TssK [Endozoicomonas arenosclerae]|uniref:type VI secretion system baseplate subunit TssK n=1 Tax=Endozoicomonas arenosclerae TaxID=1633495 RepID=UPI0007847DF1|nr:type VI secretion system baseplate subunit TssK [Endozoicomonas arenosclerae]
MDSHYDRVVWLEGMFLSPQHFQQQERYLEHYIRKMLEIFEPGRAGFIELKLDPLQLKAGKVYLRKAVGVFPDGSPFILKRDLSITVTHADKGSTVYLALPLVKGGYVDTALEENVDKSARHASYPCSVLDSNDESSEPVDLQLSSLNLSLLCTGVSLDNYTFLAVARIHDVQSDGELLLDNTFIPRCLNYKVSAYLEEQVQSLYALMRQRAAVLAAQVGVQSDQKSYQTLQISYMWLRSLNRYSAELKLINEQQGTSAYQLYSRLVVMASEISTFTQTLAPEFDAFDEFATYASYAPVLSSLLQSLQHVSQDKVVHLEWDRRLFSSRRLLRTRVEDRSLFSDSRFILAVSSSLGRAQSMEVFPISAKLCGQTQIAEKVRNALSGVSMEHLPSAPIEIRSKSQCAYFEIDTNDSLWLDMVKKQDILALHVDEQMPDDTQVDCYVIR